MTTPTTLITPALPDWMVTVCRKAGPDVLELAEWVLYAGVAFGIATALAEAIAAFRGRAAQAPVVNRAALAGVQAIIAALTSLLQQLKDAKAWLALVIVGLVLLVIGASAPGLCVPEQYRPQMQQQTRIGTGGTGGTSGGSTSGRPSGEPGGRPAGGAQSPTAPPGTSG